MITRRHFWMVLAAVTRIGVPRNLSAHGDPDIDVLLFECPVAGYRFHEGPLIEQSLKVGDELRLRRESDNVHDALAVRIETVGRECLGYIPYHLNSIPSRLLDGGIGLRSRISTITLAPTPPWKRLRIAIFVPITARADRRWPRGGLWGT